MRRLTVVEHIEQQEGHARPRVMIAREGTELAERLRDHGWATRAGWRATSRSEEDVWFFRFEAPEAPGR